MIAIIIHFLCWTGLLYWIHRASHSISYLRSIHADHHAYIAKNNKSKWHINNLLLFNDTWTSTADLWITEVIPTLLYSYITGQWWILIFYYMWAAFIQESIEHRPSINFYPFLTSGQWHLVHHRYPRKNFGLFLPIWDKIFGTAKSHSSAR